MDSRTARCSISPRRPRLARSGRNSVESLGVEPEPPFRAMSSTFRDALAVGRPMDFAG